MKPFSAFLLALFVLAACNLPAETIEPTVDVNFLQTQVVATVIAEVTNSAPTSTATPLPTASPSPEPAKIYFSGDTNCRTGPGVKFALVSVLKEGQTVLLAGQPKEGDYWVVVNPDRSGLCWVVRDFATPIGSTDKLTIIVPPSTSTPMPLPLAPALVGWDYSCEYASANSQSLSTITVELKWQDSSDYELGYNVYRNRELIASLPPDTIAYTDVTYLSFGQAAFYYVEAWNYDGTARSKEVKGQCQ